MQQPIKTLELKLEREIDPRKRIFLFRILSDKYFHIDAQKAINLSLRSIQEARKTNDKVLLGSSYLLAAKRFRESKNFGKAFTYCHKAIATLQLTKNEEFVLDARSELAATVSGSGSASETLVLYFQILNERISLNSVTSGTTWENRILNTVPTPLERKNQQLTKLGLVYYEIAIAFYYIGEKEKALENVFKGLKLLQQAKNQAMIACSYDTIAGIYNALGNRDLAIKYIGLALKKNKVLNHSQDVASNLSNMSLLYFGAKKIKKGIHFANLAIDLYLKIGLQSEAARTYILIAEYERTYGSLLRAEQAITKQ
jgi:tetratricopeptide (TPR) repeat protein